MALEPGIPSYEDLSNGREIEARTTWNNRYLPESIPERSAPDLRAGTLPEPELDLQSESV
jgi:hypothetical protein